MAVSFSAPSDTLDITTATGDHPSYLSELDELRRLMGAERAFVVSEHSRNRRAVLAASPNSSRISCSDLSRVPEGYQAFKRGGCFFVLDKTRPNGRSRTSSLSRGEAQEHRIEHLVSRSLGKLVLGAKDSLLFQVSESASRCLAASSSCMLRTLEEAESIAGSERPVLITGETGVGKDLLARFIHRSSFRQEFVPVSLAQVRGDTAISELFGHTPGAFTGAMSRRSGAFAAAGDGTLFLDEIAEVEDHVSAALLRAIEEKRIKPLGSDTEIEAPARIIAATNRPDKLRPDLFYRFIHRIEIPPLRERPEDIRAIARFIAFREGFELSDKALTALQFISPWKGNVRELEYVILQARKGSRSPILGLKNLLEALPAISAWDENSDNGIRQVRKTLNMSLRDFSQVVGIPKSSLADMEKGRASARNADVIRSLCRYLEALPDGDASRPSGQQRASRVKEELKRFIVEE